MNLADVIISQYDATLEMLRHSIVGCPELLWNDPADRTKYWHIAYHALFYTHLYLQDSPRAFVGWEQHRPDYQFLGPVPWPPHRMPEIGEPYTREQVLEYLSFCEREVEARVPGLDLAAKSGFDWLPFDRLELQFYTIRHLQQHTGELMERLGTRAGVEGVWIGSRHRQGEI